MNALTGTLGSLIADKFLHRHSVYCWFEELDGNDVAARDRLKERGGNDR